MRTVLAVLLVITAVGTTAYWLDFFLRGTVHVVEEEWYLRFERSFPVADGWMIIASVIAAIGLFADAGYGVAFALVAAGALVFLGLMDLTFDVQNRLFRLLPGSGEMWTEVFIIVWCHARRSAAGLCRGAGLRGPVLRRVATRGADPAVEVARPRAAHQP